MEVVELMSLQEPSAKIIKLLKDITDLIIEFKNFIIVIIIWLILAELSGYSFLILLRSIGKLLLYPLNLLLFRTDFSSIEVPEIFILLFPLVILVTVGFFVLIATED